MTGDQRQIRADYACGDTFLYLILTKVTEIWFLKFLFVHHDTFFDLFLTSDSVARENYSSLLRKK